MAKVTAAAVKRILTKWRKRIGIDPKWTINATLYNDQSWPAEHKGDTARVDVSAGYFQASIAINVDEIARDSDSLEYTLVHEISHIVVHQLAQIARAGLGEAQEPHWREVMENCVETFTRALLAK